MDAVKAGHMKGIDACPVHSKEHQGLQTIKELGDNASHTESLLLSSADARMLPDSLDFLKALLCLAKSSCELELWPPICGDGTAEVHRLMTAAGLDGEDQAALMEYFNGPEELPE